MIFVVFRQFYILSASLELLTAHFTYNISGYVVSQASVHVFACTPVCVCVVKLNFPGLSKELHWEVKFNSVPDTDCVTLQVEWAGFHENVPPPVHVSVELLAAQFMESFSMLYYKKSYISTQSILCISFFNSYKCIKLSNKKSTSGQETLKTQI